MITSYIVTSAGFQVGPTFDTWAEAQAHRLSLQREAGELLIERIIDPTNPANQTDEFRSNPEPQDFCNGSMLPVGAM